MPRRSGSFCSSGSRWDSLALPSRSVRSYVARLFSKESRGFAMGFFGAGSIGAALNMFVAPFLIGSYGWQSVPRVYAVALLVTAVLFWLFSAPDPGAGKGAGPSIVQQLS